MADIILEAADGVDIDLSYTVTPGISLADNTASATFDLNDAGIAGPVGPAGTTDYNALSNKPTIPTDTTQLTNGAGYATTAAVATKQDTLVSGTTIKTVNNVSLLGSGDITITGSGSSTNPIPYVIALG